jgi:hypothetical protein
MSSNSKTYQVTFKVKSVDGQHVMIRGLITGMCKKHAVERAADVVNAICDKRKQPTSFTLKKVVKIKRDFAITPREESEVRSGRSDFEGFQKFLREKLEEIRERKDKVAKEAAEAHAKDNAANDFKEHFSDALKYQAGPNDLNVEQ